MSGLELRGVSYRYPAGASPAVAGVDLRVAPGEIVLLTGPTGCGKSTLLRVAAGLLQRHGQGDLAGEVRAGGLDPGAASPAERVRKIGFVSQEPLDQLIAGAAADEVSFAMESAGMEPAAMERAIPDLLAAAGLAIDPGRDPRTLSGGQVQRLVTAAALSAGAGVLLLDEPLAQLDPAGAAALRERLLALAASGVAVLVVEHRLEAMLPGCHRLAVLDEGRLVLDAPAADLRPGAPALALLRRLGLSVPGPLDLADRLAPRDPSTTRFLPPLSSPIPSSPAAPALLSLADLTHRYPGAHTPALSGINLQIQPGERVALVGGNGAGKSTLLAALARAAAGRAVAVPQDPDLALFCATVADELAHGPRERRLPPAAVAERVQRVAAALSLSPLLDRPPQALSRGQRLRAAVAAALACAPEVLLLDEPTSGQDRDQVERMMAALRAELSAGALVFATHDLDLALRHATRVVALHAGRIVAAGPPAATLAALPSEVPLPLPPLALFCLERGLPLADAEALAGWANLEPPSRQERQDLEEKNLRNSGYDPPNRRGAGELEPRSDPGVPGGLAVQKKALDPRTRLALLLCAGVLAVTLERPLALGIFAVVCALPLALLRVERRWWLRGLGAAAAITWSTALSQGLFYAEMPRVSLGHLGPLHLYREGVLHGLAQSLRFVGLTLAGIAVALSTPADRMHAALLSLKVPFGLALMAGAALRFLPEITRELLTVRQARAARGRPAWRRGPLAWLALEIGLLRPVIARSWRRAQNLAESLDARGFDPLAPRRPRQPLRLRWWDGALLTLAGGVGIGALGLRILMALYLTETLYFPAFRPLYGFVRRWM